MGETIKVLDLERLTEGNIFDGDELIIFRSEQRMETLRQEPESDEIRYYAYDVDPNNSTLHYNGGGEFMSGEPDYHGYKQKLEAAKLWH